MRYFILLAIITFSFASAAQDKKQIDITGEIMGVPKGTFIYLIDLSGDTISTTTIYGSNRFRFSENLYTNGAIYFIKIDTTTIKFPPAKNTWIRLVTEESNCFFKTTLKDWPADSLSLNQATSDYNRITQEGSKIMTDLNEKFRSTEMDSVSKAQVSMEFQELFTKFLLKYPNSFATAWTARKFKKNLGYESVKKIYDNLTNNVKNSYPGKRLNQVLVTFEVAEKIKPGVTIPSINAEKPDGTTLNILEFAKQNKLTLIDFWASWCTPCRKNNLFLAQMYNKFKASGFNIIGVSIDKRTEDWKQAIREDKTTWTHVVDKIDKAFQNCFDIQSVPSYMLLDEEGRIIAFHSSHSIIETFGPGIKRDELEKTLLRLINRK